jgi:hypothetical protein
MVGLRRGQVPGISMDEIPGVSKSKGKSKGISGHGVWHFVSYPTTLPSLDPSRQLPVNLCT